jgi:hypothetical protein
MVPVGLAHGEPALGAFWRSQSRRQFRCRVIDLDTWRLFTHDLLNIFGGDGVAAALRLPARALEDPTLGPIDDSLTDSALRVRTEIRTTEVGESSLKPRMGETKLSRAYNCLWRQWVIRMKFMNWSVIALPGPFPFQNGRRKPARLKASYWYSGTFLLVASPAC